MVTITIKIFHFHHPKTSLTAPGNHQSALFILDQFCTFYNVIYVESYCRYSCFCLLFSLCIHLCCCEFIHSFFFLFHCSVVSQYTDIPQNVHFSSNHLLMGFCVLFNFWLLWIKSLWALTYKSLWEHVFFSLRLGTELLIFVVSICLILSEMLNSSPK